jgi:hypothetical protein
MSRTFLCARPLPARGGAAGLPPVHPRKYRAAGAGSHCASMSRARSRRTGPERHRFRHPLGAADRDRQPLAGHFQRADHPGADTQGRNPFQLAWAAPGVIKTGDWRYLRPFDIAGTTELLRQRRTRTARTKCCSTASATSAATAPSFMCPTHGSRAGVQGPHQHLRRPIRPHRRRHRFDRHPSAAATSSTARSTSISRPRNSTPTRAS